MPLKCRQIGRADAAVLNICDPYEPITPPSTRAGMEDRPMAGNWISTTMMDESGTTAMKYALIAVLLVLAVYHG